jgi:hypothetical protein
MTKWVVVPAVGLAVVVASGATAASLVTSGDIKNKTIKKKDLSGKAVRQLEGNEGPQGPQGPRGAQGPEGPPGPNIVNRLTRVEAEKTVAAGDVDSVDATCPAGQGIVTGAFRSISADGEVFFSDTFESPDSWAVGLDNFDSTVEGTVTAIAFCAPSGQAVGASNRSVRKQIEAAVAAQLDRHAR